MDGELSKIAQARVARAKIVDCYQHSPLLKYLKNICSNLGTLHDHAFGQLELQRLRVRAGFAEDREQPVQKAFITKFHGRNVDSHAGVGKTRVCPRPSLRARL